MPPNTDRNTINKNKVANETADVACPHSNAALHNCDANLHLSLTVQPSGIQSNNGAAAVLSQRAKRPIVLLACRVVAALTFAAAFHRLRRLKRRQRRTLPMRRCWNGCGWLGHGRSLRCGRQMRRRLSRRQRRRRASQLCWPLVVRWLRLLPHVRRLMLRRDWRRRLPSCRATARRVLRQQQWLLCVSSGRRLRAVYWRRRLCCCAIFGCGRGLCNCNWLLSHRRRSRSNFLPGRVRGVACKFISVCTVFLRWRTCLIGCCRCWRRCSCQLRGGCLAAAGTVNARCVRGCRRCAAAERSQFGSICLMVRCFLVVWLRIICRCWRLRLHSFC